MNVRRKPTLRVVVAAVGVFHALAGSVAIIVGAVMVRLAATATHTARQQEEFGAAMAFKTIGVVVSALGVFSALMAVGCIIMFQRVGRTSQVSAGGIVFLGGATIAAVGFMAMLWRIYF